MGLVVSLLYFSYLPPLFVSGVGLGVEGAETDAGFGWLIDWVGCKGSRIW